MATIDTTVTQTPVTPPQVDPNVKIPDHVRKAAELADSFYKKTDPTPEAPTKDVAAPPLQPELPPEPKPVEPVQHAQVDTPPQPQEDPNSDTWQHKFLSMQGRWRASQQTIGQMQEQMAQLGDELVRTQSLVEAARGSAPTPPVVGQDHKKLITDKDRTDYGDELIDLARRAAMESVGPELSALRNENNELKSRVISSAQRDVNSHLSRSIPNWVAINRSAEFKSWLRLRNIYTGRVRQEMLNEAYKAADAPKVVAFFRDFLNEEVATGRMQPTTQTEPPREPNPAPAPAPREAALSLEALAAPGRARPATGEGSVPVDKPQVTRAQIRQFYADVRRGVYAGRDAEKANLERMIFDAQNAGRVSGT